MANIKKAAILVRESRDNQDPDSQMNLCLRNAEKFGYDVPAEYQFCEHITGMDNGEDRESVRRLKNAIEINGDIKAVFVTEVTRISRNAYTVVEQLKWFQEHHIPIYIDDYDEWTGHFKEDGKYERDEDTETHIFQNAKYGSKEWLKIRKRTLRGRKRAARKGLFIGMLSDGYKVAYINKEKHIVVDSIDEFGNFIGRASIIARIFDLYTKEKYSTDKISSILNQEGVPTFSAVEAERNKDNKRVKQTIKVKNSIATVKKSSILWSGSTIGQILKNRWYIGERKITWKAEEEAEVTEIYHHDPIVSVEQFEEAQARLVINKKVVTKRREYIYPLSNILYCGNCGMKMNGHKVRINSSYYCSSIEHGIKCGAEGICKQNIDSIVWLFVYNHIPNHYLLECGDVDKLLEVFKLRKEDKEALAEKVKNLRNRIDTIKTQNINDRKQIPMLHLAKFNDEDELNKPYYDNQIKDIQNLIKKRESEISELNKEIKSYELLLETDKSIDESIFATISNVTRNKDIATISDIIHKLIHRVTLYNLTSSYKLIEIEVISGKKFYALYNARRFKKGTYIELPTNIDDIITYDNNRGCFKVNNYALMWHHWQIGLADGPLYDRFYLQGYNKTEFDEYRNYYPNEPYLVDEFSVEELMGLINAHKRELLRWIVRIEEEPSDEEYKSWKEQYKEWHKKRKELKTNDASPKKTILRDDSFEEIEKQRKRLYRQSYKVKHRQNISDETKQFLLQEIDEKLKNLKAQIKYTIV